MRLLPDDVKQQIIVEVDLFYCFNMAYADEILRIAEILKEHGLEPMVSDGRYYGPCKELKCKGGVNLLIAETICRQLGNIPTHASIIYDLDGSFTLTS